MPSNDYRLAQMSTADINGGDAIMSLILTPKRSIQSDAIDGDEARGAVVHVKLTGQERQMLQAIRDRAAAKMDARRAARALDQSVSLSAPLAGEAP